MRSRRVCKEFAKNLKLDFLQVCPSYMRTLREQIIGVPTASMHFQQALPDANMCGDYHCCKQGVHIGKGEVEKIKPLFRQSILLFLQNCLVYMHTLRWQVREVSIASMSSQKALLALNRCL